MRLSRIKLTDYRAFEIAVLDVPPSGLVLIAGANNSGKSALLSAFDAALRGVVFPDMGFRGKDGWAVTLTFTTTDRDRETVSNIVRQLKPGFTDSTLFKHVEITVVQTKWGVKPTLVSCGPDLKSMTPVARLDLASNHPSTSGLLTGPQATSQNSWHVDNAYTDLAYSSGHPVHELLTGYRELQNGFYHFEPLRQGATPSPSFNSNPILEPTGANLPAVLRHLDDNNNAAFRRVAETLSALVPEIGELDFRSSGTTDEVVLNDPLVKSLRQNLQNLGTGVEQLLLTLVVGIAQPQAKTVLIEEPETALEPGAQRALLGLIRGWASDRLFVVSTHSTAMIDWSSSATGQLYHVRRRDSKSSLFKIRDDFRGVLNALDVRMSDVLSAETVLITEGPTDREILAIFMPELFQAPSIAIVPGGGGNSARFAHVARDWIAGADALESRKLVFLRDRDELSPHKISELEGKGVVRALKRREIENYLFDADALYQVFSAEPEFDGSVSLGDIQAALHDAVDASKEAVILGRVWWEIEPIRLVDQKVRSELADDPDKLNKFVAIACEPLPTRRQLTAKIKKLWAATARSVEEEWPTSRLSLAPGEYVLTRIYNQFLGREFNKNSDGPKLARAVVDIHGTPADLRELLADLLPSQA